MLKFSFGVLVGLVLFPLAALAIAFIGWLPVEATANPPTWETVLARRAVTASVAREAPALQNPIRPTSDNLRAGMKLFLDDCAGCHGDRHRGQKADPGRRTKVNEQRRRRVGADGGKTRTAD